MSRLVLTTLLLAPTALLAIAWTGPESAGARPEPPPPVYVDPLLKDRHVVDTRAPETIGSAYACSVVTAPSSANGRLLILVTSATAVPGAQALRTQLDTPSRVKVRVVDRRYKLLTMEMIRRRALATRPRDMREVGLGEGKLYYDRCPRVEIGIPPAGEASPAALRWARGLLKRFGPDRIVVRRRGPTTL